MTATSTFDVFSSLDGDGAASEHRLAVHGAEQRMVFGANTHRAFARMLASSAEELIYRPTLH